MRARLRSYGETSTRTRSPGRMRMRNRRILPATCPSTSWPLSSCTLNIALGSASTTSPSNSTFSSFAKPDRVLSSLEGLGAAPSDHADVRRLRALRALAELVLDLRALREGPEPVALDRREVHERVLPAVVGRDEPEPLLVAEPLHDPSCHFPHDLRCIALDRRKRTYPSSGAGGRGSGCPPRRRLVLVGMEAGFLTAGLAVALGLGLLLLGRLLLGDDRIGRGDVAVVRVLLLADTRARVLAEERRGGERLGRRGERRAAARRLAHVLAPDLGREPAAVDRTAVVEVAHLGAVVGVADPDGGRHPRREADEPGVGVGVGRPGLAAGRRAADARPAAGAAGDVLLQDLGRLVGDAVAERLRALDAPATRQLALAALAQE